VDDAAEPFAGQEPGAVEDRALPRVGGEDDLRSGRTRPRHGHHLVIGAGADEDRVAGEDEVGRVLDRGERGRERPR